MRYQYAVELVAVAAVIIAGVPPAQDPPDTTGAGADEPEDDTGGWEGDESSLDPELLFELLLLELLLEDDEDWLEVAAAELVERWPWNDFAAATEMTPVSVTAPAISQRLRREISASPALRAFTERGLIVLDGRGAALENAKRAVRKR